MAGAQAELAEAEIAAVHDVTEAAVHSEAALVAGVGPWRPEEGVLGVV